jgi:hypothetical protein
VPPAGEYLVVERLPDRRLRVTSPLLPGWACAQPPRLFLECLDSAWTELQIAAYAAQHGEAYDLAHHAEPPAQPPPTSSRRYPERYDPADWAPLPGGSWRSPSGRTYAGTASVVLKVIAKRRAAGLPVVAPDVEEAG